LREPQGLALDVGRMIAGSNTGAVRDRLKAVLKEVSEARQSFSSSTSSIRSCGSVAPGSPARGHLLIRCSPAASCARLCATTLDEYRPHIEKDAAREAASADHVRRSLRRGPIATCAG